MRTTRLFGQTLRNSPPEAVVVSHDLLTRAGLIRQIGAGIYAYLHLAKRTITKIENIIRQEMEAIGGQEISMPFVSPADLWKETGRWLQIGEELGRFRDRNDHEMVMAIAQEEIVGDLIRREIHSYTQLPQLVFNFHKNWCDDPHPSLGLIRLREFRIADSYSIDVDEENLDLQYQAHFQAFINIFNRCDLPVISVQADIGRIGSTNVQEFIYQSPIGENTILTCKSCGYKADEQIARFRKEPLPFEEPKRLEKVSTPGAHSIDSLCEFLQIPRNKTAKAVFLVAQIPYETEIKEKFIFAVVRGDMDLNETKLLNALQAREIRPARDEEIRTVGAVPGFASPIGLKNVLVIVDDIIPTSANLVSGANEQDYHFLNVNYQRDYVAFHVMDITSAKEGNGCPECGSLLTAVRGIEVCRLGKLGTGLSDKLKCQYLAQDGRMRPVFMGSYRIGIERIMACIVEEHHDLKGIIWPALVAPYQIHIILLRGKENKNNAQDAENLYSDLIKSGLEVLFDDGYDSPGVKFNNADLIGCPIRITISDLASEAGGVELKLRHLEDRTIISTEYVVEYVKEILNSKKVENLN
jgi:prolyl-tRNA synthetase